MNRKSAFKKIGLFCLPISLLLISLNVMAATSSEGLPKPGTYCPDREILLITAEELSTSLNMSMRSRNALMYKDRARAESELFAARTVLELAASRGAAARTNQLIDALIQSWSSENLLDMLSWFPVLKASLLTLPEGAHARAAEEFIGQAEEIMQGFSKGDAMQSLKDAKQMLGCDELDIPLREAMQAQDDLMKKIDQNAKDISYTKLRDALRNALLYALSNSEDRG